ncbi:Gfo/Idh/MocA family protein [Victivallis vadensis]|uniref:Gfo/Idh/MocA family protein n=1 Tax=Victivallis vadensis TaxID=172901 RepID=UPI003AF4B44D
MKKILRTAVSGLGRIAWDFHLPQLCRHAGFEPVAVVDPCRERLAEAASRFGVGGLYTDFKTMLDEQRPDLVVIASPTLFHAEQAIAAMQADCDVFCDKPLSVTLTEAEAMLQAARRTGRRLMTYQPHRLNGEARTVRAILDSGRLGRLYLIERHVSNYCRRNDWQAFYRNGGGMLLNYGAHYIDQFLYLTGGKVRRARCELRRIASLGDADDVVHALITTTAGVLLDLDINQAVALPLPEWRICGERGSALYQDGEWRLRYFAAGALPERKADTGLAAAGRRYPSEPIAWRQETLPESPADPDAYYRCCYEHYALGRPPFVTGDELLELMRTLDECRRSAGELEAEPALHC